MEKKSTDFILQKFCDRCDLALDAKFKGCPNCHGQLTTRRLRPLTPRAPVEGKIKVHSVTKHQKKVLLVLLEGGTVAHEGHKYRVRDKNYKPMHRLSVSGFLRIKKYLRERDDHRFVISFKAIEHTRRGSWIRTVTRIEKKR